ncbi:flp operon protein D [Aggregatibacter actinomycetemcomitans]|uniref:Pilus assembly protein n=1 Tax=Aggregatibacter actinomycetemcomitans TaxID=714 RepID=Q7X0L9_AGGAC|nr:flp operon protein D [Aggregatibacter actinomycetemcomitans]AFI87204.1 pilus assembly protein [Aggregatibacter actinomycetemcomitans D7S-1]AAP43987.1 TadZ [Aggregatibacter actinomycetemcomitans]AMQ94510.1 pilus assembly protein [Aggregatibacter actinomycetemcomitans]QEH45021.1 pilus assembly protein [Aggregatibacter actinomycetemcomitans]QEH49023.1 pilus assembly protein [Aggregatibacter actinomycetemcomitans]
MLLLDQETITADSARTITVVSSRDDIQGEVAQTLRTRGLENIEIVKKDFFTSSDEISFSAEDTVGVIIDITHETNIKTIVERVFSVVPQNVWCCVIGDSDSISLSQKLLDEGILYFNSHTQLSQMVEKIILGVDIPRLRDTVKIAVLSCKGGIGASLISSHIANEIVSSKKIPVLLAQGPNGSQDLDLLFDKKLSGNVIEYAPNLDIFNGGLFELTPAATEKYNFIIYDQPIYNVKKDNFIGFLENYNNFVLVVERKIGSLRLAKQFLDECERIRSTSRKPIRTFVCISDNRLEAAKLMAKNDIETLIGSSIDAIIPYVKNTNTKTVLGINLGRDGKKEINSLMLKVIGAISRSSKPKEKQSLFSSFFTKLIKQ